MYYPHIEKYGGASVILLSYSKGVVAHLVAELHIFFLIVMIFLRTPLLSLPSMLDLRVYADDGALAVSDWRDII